MRRLLSMTLLLMLLLPVFGPLLALAEVSESRLALCCRKDGQHHCMASTPIDGLPRWTAPNRCPMSPHALSPVHRERTGVPAAALVFGEVVAHPAVRRQTEARARMALDRARHTRGPPADILS